MILDIDLGNTRLKWRENTAPGVYSASAALPVDHIEQIPPPPLSSAPRRIRISTVRGAAAEEALVFWALRHYGLRPEFARPLSAALGVKSGYEEPERLGVDRWLGILAAFHAVGSSVVVFDFGSAMTVDAIDGGGVHLGGCIGPGMRMMERSLLTNTDLVRFSGEVHREISPGANTRAAVANGVLAAAAGFANETWIRLAKLSGAGIAIATGGDAEAIAPHLRFPVRLEPDLVLSGLALALP